MTEPSRYTSRKFWFCVILCIVATALLCYSKIPPEVWERLVTWVASVYVVGNVGAKAVARFVPTAKENQP
jgi:glucan phosphoethanolaminetransferase (alkaline phosphatase superfamily)